MVIKAIHIIQYSGAEVGLEGVFFNEQQKDTTDSL